MPVYIAYNHKGEVISVVAARNEDLALAFWHGAGIVPYTHKDLSNPAHFIPPNEHPTGVIPIVMMKEETITRYDINIDFTYLKQFKP